MAERAALPDPISPRAAATGNVERPVPSQPRNTVYGSDVVADTLRALDIPYIALNPGASYRGLHDSLVNRLGNVAPQMLLCLHEEHAVSIAQGYAKVTERPMLAAVHSNVGLLHATMAIFNAWCDRAPLILLGATGPVDAALRRPWIEWIHTASDQGAVIRNFVKWDDQPASPAAAREAVLRAAWIARTAPKGPVYINLDSAMQESVVDEPLPEIDPKRFVPEMAATVSAEQIARLAQLLRAAQHPVILMGRVNRQEAAWAARVALAERLNAKVITSLKLAAAFPTDHPLHVGTPTKQLHAPGRAALQEADLILSLDWIDLAGTLKTGFGHLSPTATIVQVSVDHHVHNGWSKDHQALPPVDAFIAAQPDNVVAALMEALGTDEPAPAAAAAAAAAKPAPYTTADGGGAIRPADIARELRQALGERPVTLLHVPVSWDGENWAFRHPLDFIGAEGGGGIGAGPGIAVGGALALRGSGRLPIALLGDGDFLMGVTALWTAAHYHIPLLVIVVNNQSFQNDEVHQKVVAQTRQRAVENKWIGMRMTEPEIDLVQMASAQGAVGIGTVKTPTDLPRMFLRGIEAVEAGHVAFIDVRTETD